MKKPKNKQGKKASKQAKLDALLSARWPTIGMAFERIEADSAALSAAFYETYLRSKGLAR